MAQIAVPTLAWEHLWLIWVAKPQEAIYPTDQTDSPTDSPDTDGPHVAPNHAPNTIDQRPRATVKTLLFPNVYVLFLNDTVLSPNDNAHPPNGNAHSPNGNAHSPNGNAVL
ncbi:hypothetical protein Pan216_32400 [Planctomycetes bacterium Pan216]|uniref:Uncharacterized protein n=1 Tax=Kolteria novifilia TaxID=2527975 RepID=A0A518B5W9_9BACT|nr:hypothetical protein Pan216_32400 [Planctomycetes bacterium Pan216]